MSKHLKVAVLSDLHAYKYEDGVRQSYLKIHPGDDPFVDPIDSFKSLVQTDKIKADYLVCCGDYTDKAKPEPFYYAWEKINKISKLLGAKIITTVGNHDLDTRAEYNHYDPKGMVMNSRPRFPFEEEDLNNKYWAKSYSLLEEEDVNFVALNSCAYHGYGKENSEFRHGRISHYTLKNLKEELNSLEKKELNILVCHHHPLRHNGVNYEDDQVMKKGDLLVNLLSDIDLGQWLIIHGHLHVPYLSYGQKGTNAPTIFSSASFSAKEGACVQARFRNQFYLLNFDLEDIKNLGLVGVGKTWNYSPDVGWEDAGVGANEMMPNQFGFGMRINLKTLSKEIEKMVLTRNGDPRSMEWEELIISKPEIKYLNPHDQSSLLKCIKDTNVGVEFISGLPIKIMEK